jgi:Tfp pilus assembly protein PilO
MKKNAVKITIGIMAGSFFLSAVFFFWQLHTQIRLNAQLEKTKKDSKQAQKDMRRVFELKKDPTRLEDRAVENSQKIPPFELVPSGLMLQLFAAGTELGLKDIRFDHEINTKLDDERIKNKLEFQQKYSSSKIELEYFTMYFKAGFQELYNFLRRVYALDRIVTLERITVERQKNIMPEQEVSMVLITYMTNTTQAGR